MKKISDSKQPLISIIVPIYNVESYLYKCLESIRQQTYQHLEIVLIDDGSTDQSYAICQEFVQKDSRIKLYQKNNGGLSDARNYGLDKCNGNYIGFVDGDDYIDSKMYEILYNNLIEFNADMSEVDFYIDDTINLMKKKKSQYYEKFNKEESLKQFFSGNKIENSVCCKLYTKEILKNTRFKVGMKYEDFPFNYAVLEKAEKIVVNSYYAGYYYVLRQNSIMNSVFSKDSLQNVLLMEEIYENVSGHLKEYAYAKVLREKMKCINRMNMLDKNNEFNHIKNVYLKEVRKYPLYKAIKFLSKKLFLSLYLMKFSPYLYTKLYMKLQKL